MEDYGGAGRKCGALKCLQGRALKGRIPEVMTGQVRVEVLEVLDAS